MDLRTKIEYRLGRGGLTCTVHLGNVERKQSVGAGGRAARSHGPSPYRPHLSRFREADRRAESKVAELRAIDGDDDGHAIADEVTKLEQKAQQALIDTYAKLTPWQKTQVARHPDRPHCLDYVAR